MSEDGVKKAKEERGGEGNLEPHIPKNIDISDEVKQRVASSMRTSLLSKLAVPVALAATLVVGFIVGRNSREEPAPPAAPPAAERPENTKPFRDLQGELKRAEARAKAVEIIANNENVRANNAGDKFQELKEYNEFRIEVEKSAKDRKTLPVDMATTMFALADFDKEFPAESRKDGNPKTPAGNYFRTAMQYVAGFDQATTEESKGSVRDARAYLGSVLDAVLKTTADDKNRDQYEPLLKNLREFDQTLTTMEKMTKWDVHPVKSEKLPEHQIEAARGPNMLNFRPAAKEDRRR